MSVDAKILFALRSARESCVSGADLSDRLGVTRAAIWNRIEELRSLGYEIEASPHQGYKLLAEPDVLHADDLRSLVTGNEVVGREIHVFQETSSTNDVVERLARDGVPEGAVVFAESQSKGRGRIGRKWVSPTGEGLWFSVLLRPNLRSQEATQLTVIAATSLARALRHHGIAQPAIKWPNDILVRERKLAGVLTELAAEIDHIRYVILGIGVNVNFTEMPREIRGISTSVRIETGQNIRRAELAASILRELDADYLRLRHGEFARIAEEWASQCTTLGRRVSIRVGDRTVHGRAEALDSSGALLLRTDYGHLEQIVGGDVTLEQ